METQPQKQLLKVCINCEFLLNNTDYLFCSPECKKDFLRNSKYKKYRIYKQGKFFEKKGLVTKIKNYEKSNKSISPKSKNKKYCSKECKKKALTK